MPQLKLDDAAHRAWFDSLMEDLAQRGARPQAGSPDGMAQPTAAPQHSESGGDTDVDAEEMRARIALHRAGDLGRDDGRLRRPVGRRPPDGHRSASPQRPLP